MTDSSGFERLATFVPALEDPAFQFGEWRGGDRRPDGVITMPYFELSPQGLEVVSAMPVEVFEWGAWLQTDESGLLLAIARRAATLIAL